MSKSEIYHELRDAYLSQESIAKEAYAIWEKEGCPDGWQVVSTCFGPMQLCDTHWRWAEMKLDLAAEMDADFIWTLEVLDVPPRTWEAEEVSR